MSPEAPGWILGHFYSQDIRIIIQKTESTESILEQQTQEIPENKWFSYKWDTRAARETTV